LTKRGAEKIDGNKRKSSVNAGEGAKRPRKRHDAFSCKGSKGNWGQRGGAANSEAERKTPAEYSVWGNERGGSEGIGLLRPRVQRAKAPNLLVLGGRGPQSYLGNAHGKAISGGGRPCPLT